MESTIILAVLDRIEGEKAVLVADDGRTFAVDRERLPLNMAEGDVYRLLLAGKLIKQIIFAPSETAKRKEQINKLMDQVFED